MPLPTLIAIIGPTGSGKTALGEELAQRFLGEIVSADSKQVYRGMDIGTAKEKELAVPQHLLDIKEPGERMTVAEYQRLAYAVIDDILARGKQPFLVGASMLYAESVLEGYLFGGEKTKRRHPRYVSLKIGIALEREELKKRIAMRTERWIEEGLLEEIQTLLDREVSPGWLYQCGQEYRYFTHYLEGSLTLAEAIEKTNISLHQYAKRQYTWWRRHPDVHWVAGFADASSLIEEFLSRKGVL